MEKNKDEENNEENLIQIANNEDENKDSEDVSCVGLLANHSKYMSKSMTKLKAGGMTESMVITKEKKLFPVGKVGLSLLFLLISCCLLMLKGSSEYESLIGIKQCGVGYWLITIG